MNWKLKITLLLIYLYVPFCILGNLAKFSDEEASLGISSIILFLVVILNIRNAISICFRYKIYFLFLLLFSWWSITSLFSFDYSLAYSQLVQVILYLLFSAAVFNLDWSLDRIKTVLQLYIFGSLITSSLTIIDFFNLVDVPRVNEYVYGKETSLGVIIQASGPFSRRSAMAAYFSISIPICAFMSIWGKIKSGIMRVLTFSTLVLSIISLMITGNRAAILGSLISISVMLILKSKSKIVLFKYFLFLSLITTIFLVLLSIYLPEQLILYKALFGIGDVDLYKADAQSESDQTRLLLFLHVINSLFENPLGHGFSNIYNFQDNNNADPHNIITQILWASGILGFVWILRFIQLFYSKVKNVFNYNIICNEDLRVYLIIIISGLLSWILCGMYHMILAMGIAWLFLGVLIHIAIKFQKSISNNLPD